MKEIRLSIECFDIHGFLNKIIEYLKDQMSPEVHPTYAIVWVQGVGDVPVFAPETGWDVLSGLKEEGKMVFFPFASPDGERRLVCLGRITCLVPHVTDDLENGVPIGLEDSIGYLVQVEDGTVIINSAIHAAGACMGPAAKVDLYPDCGVLDEPMEKFIRGFIKEDEAETFDCLECGCAEGELHDLGCLQERCPFCGGQLATCDCCYDTLGLRDMSKYGPETDFLPLATYEDGLTPEEEEQWLHALNEKGRRPFIWWPNVCARCGKLMPSLFMVPDEDWEKYIDPRARREVVCLDCYFDITALIDGTGRR